MSDDFRGSAYFAFIISHRTPLGGCKNALLRRLCFVAKDLLDQVWIGTDALEEHKVRAERLLGGVGILDVALARSARLALGCSERVLTFDVVGSEGSHVGGVLTFARLLGGLRAASVGLDQENQRLSS